MLSNGVVIMCTQAIIHLCYTHFKSRIKGIFLIISYLLIFLILFELILGIYTSTFFFNYFSFRIVSNAAEMAALIPFDRSQKRRFFFLAKPSSMKGLILK